MAARLVFFQSDRKPPSLNRGWHTPDPSPTRDAAGLPGCHLKLYIAEAWSTEGCSTRGRSTVPTVWTSRTPSPSPTRQHLPSHAAKMCVQAIEDQMPATLIQSNLRIEEASLTESSSTRDGSMVPMDWTSRTPSPSPTRQQFPSQTALSRSTLMTFLLQPLELSFPHFSESRGVEIEAPPKPVEEPRPRKAKKARKAKQKETRLARTTGENAESKASEASKETSVARMTRENAKSKASETFAVDMPTVSKGSVGHPFSCGEACKYVMRKDRGCLDGAFCIRCHLCAWKKQVPHKAMGAPSAPTGPPSSQLDAPSQPEQC